MVYAAYRYLIQRSSDWHNTANYKTILHSRQHSAVPRSGSRRQVLAELAGDVNFRARATFRIDPTNESMTALLIHNSLRSYCCLVPVAPLQ